MGHNEGGRRVVRPPGTGRAAGGTARSGPRPTTGAAPWQAGAARADAVPGTPAAARPAAHLARELYRGRAAALRSAVRALDTGIDDARRAELADTIRAEYRHRHGAVPLGLVAVCHLGPPYVDHVLNLAHVILGHYAPHESLPPPFGGARMLARSGSYAWIEVYDDGVVLPVLADGTVVRP